MLNFNKFNNLKKQKFQIISKILIHDEQEFNRKTAVQGSITSKAITFVYLSGNLAIRIIRRLSYFHVFNGQNTIRAGKQHWLALPRKILPIKEVINKSIPDK